MLLRASASAACASLAMLTSSSAAGEDCSPGSLRCQAWLGGGRSKMPGNRAALGSEESVLTGGTRKMPGIRAALGSAPAAEESALTGVLFQPFQELNNPLLQVPLAPSISLARQRYTPACEAAINEQINVEYSVSYIYHALFAYFDRDNVALPGMAKFFKESSEEEREHAEKFIKYQNVRGGRVVLHSILQPTVFEFDHVEKGDALYAMELALSLEKLTNEKLLALHKVADENDDPQLQDFVESEYLYEQVVTIKRISEYVSQLRRVGKGHGVYHFDRVLLEHNGNGA